jgi:hypothetical protein
MAHNERKANSPLNLISAQPGDIAGVGWCFRFGEDDMQRCFHALAIYENKPGVE